MTYITVLLNKTHRKKEFSCGNDTLDRYFHTQAGQDVKRNASVCYVLVGEENTVKGYYTLTSASVSKEGAPEEIAKRFPYDTIPTILLGRLAVDGQYKGQGIGKTLLIDALRRSYNNSLSIGAAAVVVDPIDEQAVTFYQKFKFVQIPSTQKMVLSMKIISKLFP